MAKRNLFWHIGPADLGTVALPQALEHGLEEVRTLTAAEARDADLDLRWAHHAAGQSRASVEGAWSRLESKVWHGRGTWLISTPGIHLASEDQRRLAMDGLRGVKVRFVVFRTPTNGPVIDEILSRWTQPLHPDRVLALDTDGTTEFNWQALLEVAGLPAQPLPAGLEAITPGDPAEPLLARAIAQEPGRPDVHAITAGLLAGAQLSDEQDPAVAASRALTAAADRIARLTAEVSRLQADNERLDRKRRKHKRRAKALAAERDHVVDAPDGEEAA